ncbi:MAG: tripartite tricarboxylate transporter substrate binding protein [Rubrivivax sp.]|nr:tripartite tricarboxylate transporter substrate binding protein [Rubrivivax sp.]
MRPSRRRLLASAAGALVAARTWAQPAARRPIRLVVAYPPGGLSDETARELAERMGPLLGASVQVEYRPGAAGALAMEALARAAPDGLSLVYSAISPLTVLPHLGPQRFDPLRDIAPVSAVMATPVLVVGTPALAASRFEQVIDLGRSGSTHLRWASSGVATTGHLVLEHVRRLSGAAITHVPYKGGGQQINDALAGHFELLSTNMARLQLDYVRQGRLKALAVGAPARLAALPDTPTLAELGYAEANLSSVFGVFAPGATPAPELDRLNAALQRALQAGELRERMMAAGSLPLGGSRESFANLIAAESRSQARLIQSLQAVFDVQPGGGAPAPGRR